MTTALPDSRIAQSRVAVGIGSGPLLGVRSAPGLKYMVDCLTPAGWKRGSIAWPAADALIVAEGYRADHPDWLVEINPVNTHLS